MGILDVFSSDKLTLADVVTPVPVQNISTESSANIAMKEAIVQTDINKGSEEILRKYQENSDLLAVNSQLFMAKAEQYKLGTTMPSVQSVARESIFSDPNVSVEEKGRAFDQLVNPQSPIYSQEAQVAAKLNSVSEDEQEEMKGSGYDMWAEMARGSEQRAIAQQIVNNQIMNMDRSFTSAATDMAEYLVPFVSSIQKGKIGRELNKATGEEGFPMLSAIIQEGEFTQEIASVLNNADPYDYAMKRNALLEAINNNPSVFIKDVNQLQKLSLLNQGLLGDYSTGERILEDMSSILDLIGAGGLTRGISRTVSGIRAINRAKRLAEAETLAMNSIIKNGSEPSSVIAMSDDPLSTFSMIRQSLNSEGDPISMALSGKPKTDFLASTAIPSTSNSPSAIITGGISSARVAGVTSAAQTMGMRTVYKDWFTDSEWAKAADIFRNRIENVRGLGYDSNNSSIVFDPDTGTSSISSIYLRPNNVPFRDARTAFNNTVNNLRAYGITPGEIALMKKNGNIWEEDAAATNALRMGNTVPKVQGGQYATRVDYTHEYFVKDFGELNEVDIRKNFLDRFRVLSDRLSGSLTSHLLDPASLFPKHIAGAAAHLDDVAAQTAKEFSNQANILAKNVYSLPKQRRAMIVNYLEEANQNGLAFDVQDLTTRGFQPEEISSIKHFRDLQDAIWYSDNQYAIHNLKNKGYMLWDNKQLGSKLPVRETDWGRMVANDKVMDASGNVVDFSTLDAQRLQRQGYTIAKLKDPVEGADYVLSANKANDGDIIRAFREFDNVLEYRPGYYKIQYKAPYFIDATITRPNGETYKAAVGMAGTKAEAEELMRTALAGSYNDMVVRYSKELASKDSGRLGMVDDWSEDLDFIGQTAFKHRGTTIQQTAIYPTTLSHGYVANPFESLSRSISSMSKRVSFGDYLSAMEERFMQRYSDQLVDPTRVPRNYADFKTTQIVDPKKAADAKTMFNYYSYLRNGYLNTVDATVQAAFMSTLRAIEGTSLASKKVVNALVAGTEMKPSVAGRAASFTTSMVFHPMRQAILQSSQTTLLAAIDPVAVFNGSLLRKSVGLRAVPFVMGNRKAEEALAKGMGIKHSELLSLHKDLEEAGLLANISRHNVVGASLEDLSSINQIQPVRSAFKKFASPFRKAGFEFGESLQQAAAFIVFRDKALKNKTVLTSKDIQEVATQARNFTGNMNRAGDMPYNSNWLSLAFQYLQFPHKMFLNMTTNRQLDTPTKLKMIAANSILWGVPFSQIIPPFVASLIPEDGWTKEWIEDGLMSVVINKMLQGVAGDNSSVDVSSIKPLQLDFLFEIGRFNFFDAMEYAERAPASSLLRKAKNSIGFMMQHDYNSARDYAMVAREFMNIASGMSSAAKSRYAFEYGKAVTQLGDVTDEDVTAVEAFFMSAGFGTRQERINQRVRSLAMWDAPNIEQTRSDVKLWYDTLKRICLSDNLDGRDPQRSDRILAEFPKAFGNDPRAYNELQGLFQDDLVKNYDPQMANYLLKRANWDSSDGFKQAVRISNIDENLKASLIDGIEKLEQHKEPETVR